MQTVSTLTIVQRALFLMELEQFRQVGSEELANIAAKTIELRFDAGELITTENEPNDKLFVIIEGEVVHLRHEVVVRRVTRGMPFGLFGILGLEDPDPEVIKAVQPTHVVALTREDFMEAVADSPGFAAGIIRGLGKTILDFAKRIEALETRLATAEPERAALTQEPSQEARTP